MQNGKSGNHHPRQLSVISKRYDLDGDGKLDEAEMALRNMDDGDGLDKREVYKRMQDLMETQRSLMNTKKLLCAVSTFAALLLLSIFGLSLAVARLTQVTDVTSDDREELVMAHDDGKDGIKVVHTVAEGHIIHIDEATIEAGDPFGIAPQSGSIFGEHFLQDGHDHGEDLYNCTLEDYLSNAVFTGTVDHCDRLYYSVQTSEKISLLSADERHLPEGESLNSMTMEPTQHWRDPIKLDGYSAVVHVVKGTVGFTNQCRMFAWIPQSEDSKICFSYAIKDCVVPACLL